MPTLVLLTWLAAPLQEGSGKPPMELSFDRVSVKAGEQAAFPISVVADGNPQEPFQIVLQFPSAHLTFVKLEPGYLAKRANWTLAAAVKDHPDKQGVRIIVIDVKPGGGSFFPSGIIAHAHFDVAARTPDGDIPIEGALNLPPSSTTIAAAEPGKITVFTVAAFGCFFYMH
jgi:hypothetical protein